jgi:DAHL domain
MKSIFDRKILAPLRSGFRPNRDRYSQLFLARGGYLLPIVLVVLVLLWVKSLAIDVERHDQYLAHLRQIQTLDARIDRNVLQARDGLLTYYDPIVNDLAQINRLQTDLQRTPSFVEADGRLELDRLLKKQVDLSQQKEESIFKFQSQNAVLINSLTYFPIAIAEIAAKSTTSPALKDRLNTLLRDILLFNLSTEKTLIPQIQREIAQISTDPTASTEGATIKMALTSQ